MSGFNVNSVRCEALFVSALQPSDAPTPADVRRAVRQAVRDLGSRGCAAQVAQEFGDHPEIAVDRMRWARRLVEESITAQRRTERDQPAVIHAARFGGHRAAEPARCAA